MQARGSGKWAAAGYSWPQLYAILRHLLSFFLTEPRMTRIARIWFSGNRKDFLRTRPACGSVMAADTTSLEATTNEHERTQIWKCDETREPSERGTGAI